MAVLVLAACGCTPEERVLAPAPAPAVKALRWVALGDSYTKGEAARAEDAWPARAAERLRAEGAAIALTANLGVTGFTTRDVIENELPAIERLEPDLVTVQVGINDLVQGVSEARFRSDLAALLDALLVKIASRRLVLVTIPDFSVARMASRFGDPAELHGAIARRNAIVAEEGQRRGIAVADIFERSHAAATDASLLAADGIHPSAAGYGEWVPVVLPALRAAIR
jgi:lysophospholipase L1-like esterase